VFRFVKRDDGGDHRLWRVVDSCVLQVFRFVKGMMGELMGCGGFRFASGCGVRCCDDVGLDGFWL